MTASSEGRQAGYSLIELLVVMLILGVVGAAITTTTVSAFRTRTYQQQMADAQFEARLVFERVRQEVRAARRVESGTPDTVTFWLDEDFDGLQQPAELVTYQVVSTGEPGRFEVVRFDDAGGFANATVLASVLRNNQPFTYTLAPPDTRAVTMDFTYDVNTVNGPQALDVSATVRLRNVS